MAHIGNNKSFKPLGGDPSKTGDLSAAAKAAAKPTRRSARGSDVAKQEKRDKRARRDEQKAAKAAAKTAGKAASKAPTVSGGVHASHSVATASSRRSSGERKAAVSSSKRRVAKPSFSSLRAKMAGASENVASDPATQRAFLKYANDNAVVRWFYQLVTGPQRYLFYLVVAVFFIMGVYLPVRDFYIANRTAQILQEQKVIRDKYNDSLGKEVKGYMSQEGIEDTARKDLDMVMPGEQTITVEGLDEDGNPVVVQEDAEGLDGADGAGTGDAGGSDASVDGEGSDAIADSATDGRSGSDSRYHGAQGADEEDSGKLKGSDAADKSKTGTNTQEYDPSKEPTTSAEVEAAERAVFENSPWYWRILDALFLFDGVNGMAVVSTGE